MPKKLKTPPKFLTQKLPEKLASFVRANVDPFLKAAKKNVKVQDLTAHKQLPDFFVWLGQRSRDFRNIRGDQLSTKHDGTYQVYNYLRKKCEKLEEKPPTPTPVPMPKTPIPKTPSPARLRKDKVVEAEYDAVSMKATGNYQGHHEEKETQYRKIVTSEQEESEPEAGDEGFEDVTDEDQLAGKPKFERLREMVTNLMAGFEEDELESFYLDHDFKKGGTTINLRAQQQPSLE